MHTSFVEYEGVAASHVLAPMKPREVMIPPMCNSV